MRRVGAPAAIGSRRGACTAALVVFTSLLVGGCRGAPGPPAQTADLMDGRTGDARAAVRLVRGPEGTLDLRIAAFSPNGEHALAALRSADSGRFRLWQLDLASLEWSAVGTQDFRNPLAMGVAPNHDVLLVDVRPGQAVATLLRDSVVAAEWPLGSGVVRAIAPDAGGSGWWLGGAFEQDGRWFLAVHLTAEGRIDERVPAPPSRWLDQSRAEFTGLRVDGDRLLLSNPTSCEVATWSVPGRTAGSLVDLKLALPELALACEAALPVEVEPRHVSAISDTRDWPLALWEMGPGSVLLVRQREREGWLLVRLDPRGRVVERARLPRPSLPRALDRAWALVGRSDLDRPGEPSHLEIWDSPSLLVAHPPLDRGVGEGRPRWTVVAPTDDAHGPVLYVDASQCIGDVIIDVTQAGHAGLLSGEPVQLMVHRYRDEAQVAGIASTLSQHVRVRGHEVGLSVGTPDGCVSFGRTLCIQEGSGP